MDHIHVRNSYNHRSVAYPVCDVLLPVKASYKADGEAYRGACKQQRESITCAASAKVSRIYDLSGRELPAMQNGLNIVKMANGKTVKVIK